MMLCIVALLIAQEMRPAGVAERLPDPPVYRLAALTSKDVDASKARAAGRALAGTQRVVATDAMKKGKWQKRKNGAWVWRLQMQSVGASGLRVHFIRFAVGGSNVWLYARPKEMEGPYSGTREEFWSGVVFGETVIVEYAPGDGKKVKKLGFVMDLISHQF